MLPCQVSEKYIITLATKSPRRQQILSDAGFIFNIPDIPDYDENFPESIDSKEIAMYLSKTKAFTFQNIKENEIIITADTTVVINNTVIGKPKDYNQAVDYLKMLSGRDHSVITGVTLRNRNRHITFGETTEVSFRPLTNEQIEYYVDKYKPYDKAGAYGIQEWIGLIGIEKISGCYYNVMGLPISRLLKELIYFIK